MASQSAQIKQRELYDKGGPYPILQAATVLSGLPATGCTSQAALAEGSHRLVAVGSLADQPHNRLQVNSAGPFDSRP